jgi:hypothetical protein
MNITEADPLPLFPIIIHNGRMSDNLLYSVVTGLSVLSVALAVLAVLFR